MTASAVSSLDLTWASCLQRCHLLSPSQCPSPTLQLSACYLPTQWPRPEHHRSFLSRPNPSSACPRDCPFVGPPPPTVTASDQAPRPLLRQLQEGPVPRCPSQPGPRAGAGTILPSARWPVPAPHRPRLPSVRGLKAQLPPSRQHLVVPAFRPPSSWWPLSRASQPAVPAARSADPTRGPRPWVLLLPDPNALRPSHPSSL